LRDRSSDLFEAQLSVVLEERPKVLSLFWGDFSHAIPRARAARIVTMAQVGSVAEARKTDAEKYARSFSVYGGQGVEKSRKSWAPGKSWGACSSVIIRGRQPLTSCHRRA
jgi:hypothetical protein